MDKITIKHAGTMPAPTWGWLKMNDADIPVPAGLERAAGVRVEGATELADPSASLEAALEGLADRTRAARGSEPDGRAAARVVRGEDTGDGDGLDLPALSAYQRRAVELELAADPARAFETGLGHDVRAYLGMLAGEPLTLAVGAGEDAAAAVRVDASAGQAAAAGVDIVAAPGATLALTVSLDAADDAPALAGATLRVFAGARARVDVTVYVTASEAATALEDEGYALDEGAHVTVRHVVLGGGLAACGLAAQLAGDGARLDIDTRYLARGDERRDFNYAVRHLGRKTVSNIDANGVLAGASKKCLRGTIDLVHGCKGSEGSERETVLLADTRVENKTVPVILCDEDDVAGNHGATIGHVRPEQLFYAACRGLSEEACEALFLRAKLEDAVLSAPDDETRANACRLGSRLVDDFEEDLA